MKKKVWDHVDRFYLYDNIHHHHHYVIGIINGKKWIWENIHAIYYLC